VTLPDIRANIVDGPGHGAVNVHDLHMSDVRAPQFDYDLNEHTQSVMWRARGGQVVVSGLWNAWYKVLIKFYFDG
jgi:hypothetical protein